MRVSVSVSENASEVSRWHQGLPPPSSTTERTRGGTASSAILPEIALARVLQQANEGPRKLFYLCHRSMSSRPGRIQQLLADLRAQNLIHTHPSLPGEFPANMVNVFVVSHVLTSILQNPEGQNLCFANAPFRYRRWMPPLLGDELTWPSDNSFLALSPTCFQDLTT